MKQGGELRREERRLPREVVLQLRLRRFFAGFFREGAEVEGGLVLERCCALRRDRYLMRLQPHASSLYFRLNDAIRAQDP